MTGICVNSPDELKAMPAEYRDILVHQVLAHTSGELSGGDHYILLAKQWSSRPIM